MPPISIPGSIDDSSLVDVKLADDTVLILTSAGQPSNETLRVQPLDVRGRVLGQPNALLSRNVAGSLWSTGELASGAAGAGFLIFDEKSGCRFTGLDRYGSAAGAPVKIGDHLCLGLDATRFGFRLAELEPGATSLTLLDPKGKVVDRGPLFSWIGIPQFELLEVSDESFLVAFAEPGDGEHRLALQHRSSRGEPLGAAHEIASALGPLDRVRLLRAGAGFLVVWRERTDLGFKIAALTLGNAGEAMGAPRYFSGEGDGASVLSLDAGLVLGRPVLVWLEERANGTRHLVVLVLEDGGQRVFESTPVWTDDAPHLIPISTGALLIYSTRLRETAPQQVWMLALQCA
jgi:hypothetical protein